MHFSTLQVTYIALQLAIGTCERNSVKNWKEHNVYQANAMEKSSAKYRPFQALKSSSFSSNRLLFHIITLVEPVMKSLYFYFKQVQNATAANARFNGNQRNVHKLYYDNEIKIMPSLQIYTRWKLFGANTIPKKWRLVFYWTSGNKQSNWKQSH